MPDTDSLSPGIAQPIRAVQLRLFHEPAQIDQPHAHNPIGKRRPHKLDPAATAPKFKRPRQMNATQTARSVPRRSKLYNAVEADLKHRGIPFVRVREAARSLKNMGRLQHFDFVVYRPSGDNWL